MSRWLPLGMGCALALLGAACNGGDFDPTSCAPPTLAQCQAPETDCDTYFATQAKKVESSPCNLLYFQAAQAAALSYPQKPAIKPTLYSGLATFRSDGGVVQVAAVPADSDVEASGLTGLVVGQREVTATQVKSSNLVLMDATVLRFKKDLATWEANGNVIDSCTEYAFEKYFDVTAWDAQVLVEGARSDHRRAFDIAYGPPSVRTSLGTRHLDDQRIRQRDGNLSDVTVPFEDHRPKNDYFRVPLGASQPGEILKAKVVFQAGPEDTVSTKTTDLGTQVVVSLKDYTRPIGFTGPIFVDETLRPIIEAGQDTYAESFAWHLAMSQRNAGILDEELFIEHERRDAFMALLTQRDELMSQLANYISASTGWHAPVAQGQPGGENWWRDPSWNPDPMAVSKVVTMTSALHATVPNLQSGNYVTYADKPFAGKATLSQTRFSSLYEFGKPCNNTGNPFFCLAYKLVSLDQAIEDALVEARNRGCLDVGAVGAVPCDWSPRDFTERMRGLGDTAQEIAFRRCDESVDSFTLLKSRALSATSATSSVNYPAEDYTTSPNALDRYFVRQRQYLMVLADVVGPLMDKRPVDGKNRLRLSRWDGDSHKMGNKWFGATLSYGVGFTMDGLPAQPSNEPIDDCAIKTRADAKLLVTASALGQTQELVDASAGIDDDFVRARFAILGQVWWEEEEALPQGLVPVLVDSNLSYETFASGQSTLALGYIILSVGGSVGGGIGYNLDISAGREQTLSGGCKVQRLGVYPSIQPFLYVDGSAFVAVEAVVARAGIKGYLTVVDLRVPLKGQLSVGASEADPTVLDAIFHLDAKLQMQFLGGRLVAFLSVGICPLCVNLEGTLVSWQGIKTEIPLFEYDVQVQLLDLKRIAKLQGTLPTSVPESQP